MNRKVFGIKLKFIIILFVILVVLIPLFVAINRSLLDKWNPQESLVGKWTGKSEIFADFKKGQSPSEFPEDWINIEITINEDGSVTGIIGDAECPQCEAEDFSVWHEDIGYIKDDDRFTFDLNAADSVFDFAIYFCNKCGKWTTYIDPFEPSAK